MEDKQKYPSNFSFGGYFSLFTSRNFLLYTIMENQTFSSFPHTRTFPIHNL